jgi:hypothetical protein
VYLYAHVVDVVDGRHDKMMAAAAIKLLGHTVDVDGKLLISSSSLLLLQQHIYTQHYI